MTGTNRNRKLLLSEAWRHYWSVLVPDGDDWQADLEAEIRKHLHFPGETDVFRSTAELKRKTPSWANDLELRFQDNSVSINFKNIDLGNAPLFTDQLVPVLSNWQAKNPLDRAGNRSDLADRVKEQCQEFVRAVVHNCGNKIRNRLLGMIKETEPPEFEIYCRPNGDIFSDEKRLPAFGLTEIAGIDITNDELQDRLGLPKYCHVHIKQRKRSKSKAGPHGSFHDQDAALIEEMKSLIFTGKARSVRQAALAVLSKAPKRRRSSDESVMQRLQKKFSEKYPNYSLRQN